MKYFVGFLASIGLIILVVILVLRGLGGGDGGSSETRPQLLSYADTGTIVRITVDGPINAEQDHRAYQITIGREEARLETFQGYEQQVLESQSYDNNQESYANFLRAIDIAGFTLGNTESENNDPRGVCASGDRYVLEILNGATEIQRFWTTSCGDGTFRGDIDRIDQLFDRQIPDYTRLTRGLGI